MAAGDMTLAKAFVEIGYKGFDKINAWMNYLGNEVRRGVQPIQGFFEQATSRILDFGRAASPVAINTLSASFEFLKATIGTAFTPYILSAAKSVQDLTRWIGSLDKTTKDNIAKWIMWGTVAAGAVVALGAVAKALQMVQAIGYMMISNPAFAAIAAIGTAAGWAWIQLDKLEKKASKLIGDVNRIAAGNITESDIKNSPIAQRLMKIEDPEERKATAKMFLADYEKAEQQLMKRHDHWFKSGVRTIFGAGAGEDADLQGKIGRDKAMLQHFLKDDKPAISKDPVNPQDRLNKLMMGSLASGMGGMGTGGGIGSLEGAYNKIQMGTLGQSEVQRELLKLQQEQLREVIKQSGNVKGIHELIQGGLP